MSRPCDLVGGIWQFYNAGQFGQIGSWVFLSPLAPIFVFRGDRERCINYILSSLLMLTPDFKSNPYHNDLNTSVAVSDGSSFVCLAPIGL